MQGVSLYKLEQLTDIINTPRQPEDTLEIEAKFGFFTQKGFQSSVPYSHYDRLLHLLKSQFTNEDNSINYLVEESTVAIMDNIRRINTNTNTTTTVTWQRKTPIRHFDISGYELRVSANIETSIDPVKKFTPKVIRTRTRHSFPLNDVVTVDMTEIIMITENKPGRPFYEVELEFHGKPGQLSIFEDSISSIFKELRGTENIYNFHTKSQVVDDVARLIGANPNGSISKSALVQARNIKRKDLVYGGIVGNSKTSYNVTYKADGLRKLLVVHSTGVWLIYPPYEFNLIMPKPASLSKSGTIILDGELVQHKTNNKIKYWYLAFDALVFSGKSVGELPFPKRRNVVDAVTKHIKTPTLTVDAKPVFNLSTPEIFFTTVQQLLDNRYNLDYDQDGLIFTPVDMKYKLESDELPLSDRSLTKNPDICKFKEGNDITIDFAIKRVADNKIELYSYDVGKEDLVHFTGNTISPLTTEMIDHEHPLTKDIPSGIIVEYEWFDSKLRPRRIRHDKSGPNRLDIALDDWEDIMNPITIDDITGVSPMLTFAYHKRIKRGLYKFIKTNNGDKKTKILDLGSGRGGDAHLWNNVAEFVVAVEPNDHNRQELVRRVKLLKLENKVRIVPLGGEATSEISSNVDDFMGKADVVTLMLSLSFFWQSEEHLNALVNTIVSNIKPGGTIVFLTIDGDTLLQLFEPALGGPHHTEMQVGSAHITLHPKQNNSRTVDFVLNNTIVGAQREYVVHLQELVDKLAIYGFELTEIHRAEGEKLLRQDQALYSSLYSYGYFTNSNKDLLDGPLLEPVYSGEYVEPIIKPMSKPIIDINPVTTVDDKVDNKEKETKPKEMAPKKYIAESDYLPSLHVGTGVEDDEPAIGDDEYVPVTCTWYDNLVRIATIGDGSCFIHSILKACYSEYQNNNSVGIRDMLAKTTRLDLAMMLNIENPKYPGHTYWETAANGAFPRLLMQEIKDPSLLGLLEVDYSIVGLQRLFNSMAFLGDECYGYVADVIDYDICVLRGTIDDLHVHLITHHPSNPRPCLVIVGNGIHYEVIAEDTADGFKTIFESDHPFITGIINRSDTIDNTVYDPDTAFVNNFYQTFKNKTTGIVDFPQQIYTMFEDPNPFIVCVERNFDAIQQYHITNAK